MTIILFSVFLSISSLLIAQKNSQYGVIETPESQVFYEGIPIQLNFQAVGEYSDLELNIPNPYTARIGSAGKNIIVSCTGVDKKGKRVEFSHKMFRVLKAPKPELYWTGLDSPKLKVSYDDGVPFTPDKASYTVVKYTIVVQGFDGSFDGEGDSISQLHLHVLKNFPVETKISVQVRYEGTSSGILSQIFELK